MISVRRRTGSKVAAGSEDAFFLHHKSKVVLRFDVLLLVWRIHSYNRPCLIVEHDGYTRSVTSDVTLERRHEFVKLLTHKHGSDMHPAAELMPTQTLLFKQSKG